MAKAWEKYAYFGLSFHYVASSPSNTVGSVMMMFDTDPRDPSPPDTPTLLANAYSVSSSQWLSCSLPVKQSGARSTDAFNLGTMRFLDNRGTGWYDPLNATGTLHVATEGGGGTGIIGLLYVEYDVEFYTPQLVTSNECATCSGAPLATNTPFANVTPLAPAMATDLSIFSANSLSVAPEGIVDVIMEATGTVGTANLPTVTTASALTAVPLFNNPAWNVAQTIGKIAYRLTNNDTRNSNLATFDFTPTMGTISGMKMLSQNVGYRDSALWDAINFA